MMVESWDPGAHLELLGAWFRARGQAEGAGDARFYPSTGFVVDRCAVGFLYTTNAPLIGYIDGLVTDPAASVRRRHSATVVLLSRLEALAGELGIKLAVAMSDVRGVVQVLSRGGFVRYGGEYAYMAKVPR